MGTLLRYLLRPETVLATFLLLKLAAVILTGVLRGSVETWTFGILSLAVYAVISWFAYRRRAVSVWAITVLMLYEGSGAFLTGIRSFDTAPAICIIGITLAVYLFLGALSVFATRHGDR